MVFTSDHVKSLLESKLVFKSKNTQSYHAISERLKKSPKLYKFITAGNKDC